MFFNPLRYLRSLLYFDDFHLTVADTKVRFLRAAVKGRLKKRPHLTLIVIKNILFWTPLPIENGTRLYTKLRNVSRILGIKINVQIIVIRKCASTSIIIRSDRINFSEEKNIFLLSAAYRNRNRMHFCPNCISRF